MNFVKDGDWGLKLLALVLAIVIYHTLKTDFGAGNKTHERHLLQSN